MAGIKSPNPIDDWELSPKLKIDPKLIVQHDSDQLGRVFVALALAYNDLKGMVLFERYLIAVGRPDLSDWTAHAGQWRGVMVQIHRTIAGILYEMMVVILDNCGTSGISIGTPPVRGSVMETSPSRY